MDQRSGLTRRPTPFPRSVDPLPTLWTDVRGWNGQDWAGGCNAVISVETITSVISEIAVRHQGFTTSFVPAVRLRQALRVRFPSCKLAVFASTATKNLLNIFIRWQDRSHIMAVIQWLLQQCLTVIVNTVIPLRIHPDHYRAADVNSPAALEAIAVKQWSKLLLGGEDAYHLSLRELYSCMSVAFAEGWVTEEGRQFAEQVWPENCKPDRDAFLDNACRPLGTLIH